MAVAEQETPGRLRTLAELLRMRRVEKEAAREHRRAALEERRQRKRVARVEKIRARRARLAAVTRAARPVAPVAMVTAFAIFGQIGYGLEHYTPTSAPWLFKAAVAVGAAITVESIANYVQWHAHEALLMGDKATALRRRVASYAVALVVAAVNYAHFAGDGLTPTPGAVVFGGFSALQPWLWGLHTRRAQHVQLKREGKIDETGATFAFERWLMFPVRTLLARRYSIAHSITDPRQAWEGSEAERLLRQADRAHARAARRAARTEAARESRTGWWTAARQALRTGRTGSADVGTRTGEPRGDEPRTELPRTEPSDQSPRTDERPGLRTDGTRPAAAARTEQDGDTEQDADRPGPTRPRQLVAVDDGKRLAEARELAAELGEIPTTYKIRQRLKCRQTVAERLHSQLKQDFEHEAVGVG